MRFLLSTLLFLFNFLPTNGQNLNKNRVISTIANSADPVYIFGKFKKSQFFSVEKPYNTHTQSLVKSDSGLYVFIDGTGLLYKLENKNSILSFVRLDSTQVWGYNLGAFLFAYKDKIYNLGGSGIWKSNGQLRVFNEKAHEWDIIPLNMEVPIISGYMEGIISYDQLNGKIYSAYSNIINEAIKGKKEEIVNKVMVLDLNTNDWSILGDFNPELIPKMQNVINLTITPLGLLTNNNSGIKLWDFPNNKLYEIKNHKDFFQTLVRGFDSTIVFYKQNYMYISRGENLDSVKIVLSDFVLVGSIYSKSIFSRIEGYTSFMFLLLFLTILIVGYFGLKRYKVKIIKDHNALLLKESVYDNNNKLVFNDQELLLLGLFITNSKLGNKTSLEELNKILGLESRPIETQKSQRHKLISSINAKYLTIANRKLIHSEKLEFDRRSNVYFIYHEDVEFISQFVS